MPRYLLDKGVSDIKVIGDLESPQSGVADCAGARPYPDRPDPHRAELLTLLGEIAPTVVTGKWDEPWQDMFRRTAHTLNRD